MTGGEYNQMQCRIYSLIFGWSKHFLFIGLLFIDLLCCIVLDYIFLHLFALVFFLVDKVNGTDSVPLTAPH